MTVSKLEKPFVNQLGNKHFFPSDHRLPGSHQPVSRPVELRPKVLYLRRLSAANIIINISILWYFIEKSKYCPVHTVYCNISIILMGNDVLLFGLTVFLQEFVFCILSDSFSSSS